jgi:hypothetical protein
VKVSTAAVLLAVTAFAAAQEKRIPGPDDPEDRTGQRAQRGGRRTAAPAGSLTTPYGLLELQRCWHGGSKITCRFTFTPERPRAMRYTARTLFSTHTIVDNLQREHGLLQSYFLDATNRSMPTVNLTVGESATFVQEFGGGSGEVHTIRLVSPRSRGEIRDIKVEAQ